MENQNQQVIEKQKKNKEQNIINNEIDDDQSSSWSLASLEELKSLNLRQLQQQQEPGEHIIKQKPVIQAKFPQKPTVLPNAPLHQVGKIIFVVGELLILESLGGTFVVDLENWICDEQRNLFGFIIDVFGKIEKPYYAIKPEIVVDFTAFIGKIVYYIQGSSKILRDEDIKSMKSKSALEAEQDQESSEEENLRIERDFSQQKYERKKTPPKRNNKFRDNGRNEYRDERNRDRTRQIRNQSRIRNEQNQRYLNNMYSMHYNQMMRLYNGQFQPYNPPPMQNPYINNQINPQINNFSHNNIAQFGSNSNPNQFYGQIFPTSQGQRGGIFGNGTLNLNQSQSHPNFIGSNNNHQNKFGGNNRNQFNGRN